MPRNSADFGICQHTVTRKMPPRPLVYLNARVTVALSFVSQRSEDSVVAAVEAEHQLSNKKANLQQKKKKRPAIQTHLATVFSKPKKDSGPLPTTKAYVQRVRVCFPGASPHLCVYPDISFTVLFAWVCQKEERVRRQQKRAEREIPAH